MFLRVLGGIVRMKSSPFARAASAAALVLAAAASGGCVERKMMIVSDPPGAAITLDGVDTELVTPAEIPFDFGGTRAVTLIAPGKRVLETTAKLEDPWFTYFPLDIGAEFLWPGTIHDVQTFDYKLESYEPLDRSKIPELQKRLDEVKLRAAQYRAGGAEGPGAVPPRPAEQATDAPAENAPKK
jgi:hypothetical protein